MDFETTMKSPEVVKKLFPLSSRAGNEAALKALRGEEKNGAIASADEVVRMTRAGRHEAFRSMSVPQQKFAAARLNRRGQDMYKLIDVINAKRSATPDAKEQMEYLKEAMSASQAAHELMLLAEMAANFAVLTDENEKLQEALDALDEKAENDKARLAANYDKALKEIKLYKAEIERLAAERDEARKEARTRKLALEMAELKISTDELSLVVAEGQTEAAEHKAEVAERKAVVAEMKLVVAEMKLEKVEAENAALQAENELLQAEAANAKKKIAPGPFRSVLGNIAGNISAVSSLGGIVGMGALG